MADSSLLTEPKPKRTNGETLPVLRDEGGRYLKGNPGGPGNPLGRHVHELRTTLLDLLTNGNAAEMKAVWRSMIDKAKEGDTAAARLVAEYSLGRPTMAITVGTEDGMPSYKVLIGVSEDEL